jgi:hypothetical protein
MAQKLEIPQFANEAEEARWWFEHQDAVADEFELAAQEGRLGHGTVARRAGLPGDVLVLEPEDAERARVQAERRGLTYQEYVKMVLHRALLNEEQSA